MMGSDEYQQEKQEEAVTGNGVAHTEQAANGTDSDFEFEVGVDSRNRKF